MAEQIFLHLMSNILMKVREARRHHRAKSCRSGDIGGVGMIGPFKLGLELSHT